MQELMMMINNPGEGQWLKHIDWNKDEFEVAIEAATKDFQNVAYGEDQIKQAKADRAELNKLKKAIEDRRKEVKKTISAPYDEFEKEVKEVTRKLDSAVAQIDAQVKGYEARQKEEKKAAIVAIFEDEVAKAGLADVDIEKLSDASWLNASVTMSKVKEAIAAKVTNLRSGFDFCSGLPEDEQAIALTEFRKRYDLGDTLAAVNEYKNTKAAMEARKAQENAQRQAEELADRLDGLHKAENENAKEEATRESEEVHADPLQEAAEGCDEPERVEEPDNAEERKKDLRSAKVGIVFNGEILCKVMDLMKDNNIACRGSMNVQLAGTKEELLKFITGLKEAGIKFGKVS